MALDKKFDLVLMKDTAEHIVENELSIFLEGLSEIAKKVLVIVPVTEKDGKKCPDLYEDKTHINMQSDCSWKEYLDTYGVVQNMPELTRELKKEYSTICCSFLVSFRN